MKDNTPQKLIECKICHTKIEADKIKAHMDNHIVTHKLDERPVLIKKGC